MNTHVHKTIGQIAIASFALPALIAVLNSLPAGRVTAQTFTTLHSFTATSTNASGVYTNSDGANPYAGLITNSSGNTLYGTAAYGGSSGNGTVFAVKTDGTGFTNLHSFAGYPGDGANPYGGLILSGNSLYGTARTGGSSGQGSQGTVFAIHTDGTGFTNLHNFAGSPSDGAYPRAGLIVSGNTLYGTASQGGSSGEGIVFAVNIHGTGFTNLHNFAGYPSDGEQPYAGLILSGNTLYGTAYSGGSFFAGGTVFAVNTNGTGFTNLLNFPSCCAGAQPQARLLLSGNTLYGTTTLAGTPYGYGTVFALYTDGTGFRNLHVFSNSDGSLSTAGLIANASGSTLYGTTPFTVFALNTDGTGFKTLLNLGGHSELILSGNTLYGTAQYGGSSGNGTVFSLSFRPQLTITPSGTNVILSWPTNVAGFDYTGYTLQSTTNLGSPAVWSTNSPAPVVIAGQNTVTNPISGALQFYRLVQ